MKKILLTLIFFIATALSTNSTFAKKPVKNPPTTPTISSNPCSTYSKFPPFLSDNAPPSTHLVVDFSGSLNEHAYQESAIIWDNGTLNATGYTGFIPSNEYYGYFDSYEYYTYSSGIFVNATDYDTSTTWSGNFLNWISMHRIDILKKVLTGGKHDNSTIPGSYTVSQTDGAEGRGQYHIFDTSSQVEDLFYETNGTTRYMSPSGFRGLLGFEHVANSNTINIYNMHVSDSSTTPVTYAPNSTTPIASMNLTVSSERANGVLDLIGPSTRLSLFTFDDEGSAHDGGEVLHYMTSNSSLIAEVINNRQVNTVTTWSPLAESLYTVCGYIQQDSQNSPGPLYESDSYSLTDETNDPFYFATNETVGSDVACTQQNIIIISDGESTYDLNIPSWLKDSSDDKALNDNATYSNYGSGYLDNVAYWAHTTDMRPDNDANHGLTGNQTVNIYTISLYNTNSSLLMEAAKWGGFKDYNNDGIVDTNEYDGNNDGMPDNYFEASSGQELEQALAISMNALVNRASSGSAASVVSTSRKGEGLLYQAVFWPELQDGNGDSIQWAGDVYAYWLDDDGILYEDDGQNSTNRLASDDSKVTIWYDDSDASNKRSKACSGGSIINGQCVNGTVKELASVRHVWRASEWLNNLNGTAITSNRSYASGANQRFIKTWIDEDNDGAVDSGEYTSFESTNTKVIPYCNATVINWIRGVDHSGLRSRSTFVDTNFDNTPDSTVTWRLGDIINSSPTVVAAPTENYDLYWGDQSYTEFYKKWKNRRIMVYFGGNDGMLHAINSGFYNESNSRYYNTKLSNGTLTDSDSALPLGAEMWAYVPYNLLPHLPCLTEENYEHQYYVDLKPRVFDAKVFKEDEDHPGGWGTIMVCGFNFGGDGSQQRMETIGSTNRYFGSSYFIFDITNPEEEPEFLGEMNFDGTFTFGFSINSPTLVATKDTTGLYWYLLFGNGPEYTNGGTDQSPTAVCVPVSEIVDISNKANSSFSFRPKSTTGDPTETEMGFIRFGQTLGGNNFKACIGTGFVSVDYDFNFYVDMMYYGLVTTDGDERHGGVHRLKVENRDPSQWKVMKMTETEGPITGAPNIGFKDGTVWVYFGSGIFWDVAHKTSTDSQWIYGIEEPKKTTGAYNFSVIHEAALHDVSNILVKNDGLGTLECDPNATCDIPSGVSTVDELADTIQTEPNTDGWRRELIDGERVIGQSTLFGGLCNFTTFTPSKNLCTPEGTSKLYALYYRTGTAWKENVFGDEGGDYVRFIANLGQGMGTSPSLHLGSEEGVRAYVQTSTGSIIEVHQPNLPIPNVKSGKGGWHTLEVD